jgi:hypothetical protein
MNSQNEFNQPEKKGEDSPLLNDFPPQKRRALEENKVSSSEHKSTH